MTTTAAASRSTATPAAAATALAAGAAGRTAAFAIDADAKIKSMGAEDRAKLGLQVLQAIAGNVGLPTPQTFAAVEITGSKKAMVTVSFGADETGIMIEGAQEAFEALGDDDGCGGKWLFVAYNGKVCDARMTTLHDSSPAGGAHTTAKQRRFVLRVSRRHCRHRRRCTPSRRWRRRPRLQDLIVVIRRHGGP